jgi:hypothetical protein
VLEEQWCEGHTAAALRARVGLEHKPPEVLQSSQNCAVCLCPFEEDSAADGEEGTVTAVNATHNSVYIHAYS